MIRSEANVGGKRGSEEARKNKKERRRRRQGSWQVASGLQCCNVAILPFQRRGEMGCLKYGIQFANGTMQTVRGLYNKDKFIGCARGLSVQNK